MDSVNIYSRDRRRYMRYECEGKLVIKVDAPASRSIQAELIDMSFTGICIQSKEKIEPDTQVDIELTTKFYGTPISGKGKVKNVKEITGYGGPLFRIGIEFIHIDGDAIESTLHCIQRAIASEKRKKAKSKKNFPL